MKRSASETGLSQVSRRKKLQNTKKTENIEILNATE